MAVLLRQATIIDPDSPYNGKTLDILFKHGAIKELGSDLKPEGAVTIISPGSNEDGSQGKYFISPGFVDLFADYREPGFEQKETIATGLETALKGGFTEVFVLPNTQPVNDSRAGIRYVLQQSLGHKVQVHPLGAISQGIEGKALAEMMDMRAQGAIAFTDGWKPIQSNGLMLKALEYVKAFDGVVIQMPIDTSLSTGGLMHEGEQSTRLGMPGIPSLAESLMVHRDIELTRYSQSKLHITGISTRESVAYIRAAKAEGIAVTCSVTPYHLLLTDTSISSYDSLFKVNPPLRADDDRQALIEGLADGTIDCITSHHRPQDWDAKAREFEYAGDGMAIQELVFPLVVKAVGGAVPLERIIDALTIAPRRIFGLKPLSVREHASGGFCLYQLNQGLRFSTQSSPSLSRNNPFDGIMFDGHIQQVIF